MRTCVLLPIALTVALCMPVTAGPLSSSTLRRGTDWTADSSASGTTRTQGAKARRLPTIKKMFSRASVTFPPARLLLRVYKKDQQLEVWANSSRHKPMKKVATYEICSQGYGLGPKTQQGDGKTPEGFYHLDFYNRRSSYHLSMRVNYPNRLDRQLKRTGSAIMIHGACASIGCLAMTDERIEELWVITRQAARRAPVAVHIFPARDLDGLIKRTSNAKRRLFWKDLKVGHDAFAVKRSLPNISIRGGRYVVR
ncbi:MAG: L,D-transpeptidase family protein [Deltaproteobacteria bacterium]|nr:L,D-transpeptidase family protein [Deltaproteobacteria bacterium]